MNKKVYESVISGRNMLKYSIIQYDDTDKIFVASVPELEGCMAHGNTPEQAMKEIIIAMKLWLEIAEEMGDIIPEPMLYVSEKVG